MLLKKYRNFIATSVNFFQRDIVDSKKLAATMRAKAVQMSYSAKAAHLASALSCIDVVSVLYHSVMRLSDDPTWIDRDRFILSKGHAATALYGALNYKKYISDQEMETYGHRGSLLEEHPSPKISGVEAATGSLGHGLSVGCGISLAGKISQSNYRTFVLMGDGECNEGSVWEAAMFASANKLKSLYTFIDFNKWQATGRSEDVLSLTPLVDKFRSFGWDALEIDGHDHAQILKSVEIIPGAKETPRAIICHTIKGKGVSFMENDNNWHYRIPNKEEVELAKNELGIL